MDLPRRLLQEVAYSMLRQIEWCYIDKYTVQNKYVSSLDPCKNQIIPLDNE